MASCFLEISDNQPCLIRRHLSSNFKATLSAEICQICRATLSPESQIRWASRKSLSFAGKNREELENAAFWMAFGRNPWWFLMWTLEILISKLGKLAKKSFPQKGKSPPKKKTCFWRSNGVKLCRFLFLRKLLTWKDLGGTPQVHTISWRDPLDPWFENDDRELSLKQTTCSPTQQYRDN